MNISKQHLNRGYRKRPGVKMLPSKITIHSTGNANSTAQNERDWLTNPKNTSSTGYHYVVGDSTIIEIVPPDEIAYHAGNRTGNYTSIGIEMVETGNRSNVIANTIKLVKKLQSDNNISNDNVVRHYDWTKKMCPRILAANNWAGWIEFKTLLRSDNKMTDKQVRDIVVDEINKSKIIEKKIQEELNRSTSNPSTWTKYWDKAKELGITDGTNPQKKASREEVIEMMFRFYHIDNVEIDKVK